MDEAEFDRFAAEYRSMHRANIAITGEDPDYFAEYKIRDLAAEWNRLQPSVKAPRILDFGAGVGASVPFVGKHLPAAELTCLDVSRKSLELGQSRFPGEAKFQLFDGVEIPFADASFDLVFAACVFHHIDPDEHTHLFREFRRVLLSGGLAMVYEHNPYHPLTRRAVHTCPFDENAQLIRSADMCNRLAQAGFASTAVKYRVFFPHALRALRVAESWLRWLPLGAQYYVLAM